MSDAELMAALGAPGAAPKGRFFPDTYAYSRGVSDLAVLGAPTRAMQQRLAAAWAERAPDTPLKTRRRGADPGLDRREGDRRWRPTAAASPASSSTACASACRCRPTRR